MLKSKFKVVNLVSLFVLAISFLFLIDTVKAETMEVGDYVSKIYMKKVKGESKRYLRSQWIYRSSDHQFVYCLEPWTNIIEGENYQVANDVEGTNISKEILEKVKLIAYYGYGYEGHTADEWYTITQMLIWRTVDSDADFFFTNTLNGERNDELFSNELKELSDLVENHYKLPSFANNTYYLSAMKEFEIEDKNSVLNNFEIIDSGIIKNKDNNKLIIYNPQDDIKEIKLIKKTNKYNAIPFVYINDKSQNVMSVGNFSPLETTVNFQFKTGMISLYKKDSEYKSKIVNNKVSLKNAVYEAYDEKNNKVGEIITDENGFGSLSNLPLGKYTIKEVTPSYGYKIDLKVYEIDLTFEKNEKKLTVYEDLDKKEIEISKEYYDENSGMNFPEEGIEFDIYEKDTNKYIGRIITDSNGKASISLPYGTYVFKQVNTREGYQKVSDFEITIDENVKDKINKHLINMPIVKIPNTFAQEMNIEYLLIPLLFLKIILKKKLSK